MATVLNRSFKVKGNLKSYYQLDKSKLGEELLIEGIEVQLWHKAPLQLIFLGKANTDDNANFEIEFDVESPVSYLENGRIKDVFIEAYYNGRKLDVKTDVDLLTGLVAYWSLDEMAATAVTDITGNGHDGSLEGTDPPDWVAGKINNGLQLNGTPAGTVSSYIEIPASSDFTFGTGDFSIAFWLKHNNTSTYIYPFNNGYPTVGGMTIEYNNSVPAVYVYNGIAGIVYGVYTSLATGVWYHIILRRINGKMNFYLNGLPLSEQNNTVDFNAVSELQFGKFPAGTFIDGIIDEIGIWKGHGLNDAEALALYNEGNGLAYPFNF